MPRGRTRSTRIITRNGTENVPPNRGKGALLLCVVGGRLSEGVNFGDDLGRLVVVAGLPYPNPTDPELVARMQYLDAAEKGAGRAYYDDLCWKAVNQSVGRAIRHRQDYATVLMLDARYVDVGPSIENRLPEWVSECFVRCERGYGEAHKLLCQFYARWASCAEQPNGGAA